MSLWPRTGSSGWRTRPPATRMAGGLPALQCRSDPPRSTRARSSATWSTSARSAVSVIAAPPDPTLGQLVDAASGPDGLVAERVGRPGGDRLGPVLDPGQGGEGGGGGGGDGPEVVAALEEGDPSPGRHEVQDAGGEVPVRSEEHTSELQSLMRISYAV